MGSMWKETVVTWYEAFTWSYWKALRKHVKVVCLTDWDLNPGPIEYGVETRPKRRRSWRGITRSNVKIIFCFNNIHIFFFFWKQWPTHHHLTNSRSATLNSSPPILCDTGFRETIKRRHSVCLLFARYPIHYFLTLTNIYFKPFTSCFAKCLCSLFMMHTSPTIYMPVYYTWSLTGCSHVVIG
jgi:hypothetical protein